MEFPPGAEVWTQKFGVESSKVEGLLASGNIQAAVDAASAVVLRAGGRLEEEPLVNALVQQERTMRDQFEPKELEALYRPAQGEVIERLFSNQEFGSRLHDYFSSQAQANDPT